jgi:tetratricopeptide (TPR) repeat protein
VYAEALIDASRAEASVLEKGDFFQEARRAWDKALAGNPNHAQSLLGKGRYLTMMAYRGGDDPKQGMELLEKVIAQKTGGKLQTEAEFYLGMGHRRLGDEVSAKAQFKKALQADATFMPAILAGQC